MNSNYTKTSKFLSKILRHNPGCVKVDMDTYGWVNVDQLITNMCITRDDLDFIVENDSKQRYTYSEDGKFIRANQGHSIPVDVQPELKEPPEFLYHGTHDKALSGIALKGLIPNGRLYVHLSGDVETAYKVGKRRCGKPIIFEIPAKELWDKGHKFWQAKNGVWLTNYVPAECLKIIDNDCLYSYV